MSTGNRGPRGGGGLTFGCLVWVGVCNALRPWRFIVSAAERGVFHETQGLFRGRRVRRKLFDLAQVRSVEVRPRADLVSSPPAR